jgi:chromosome segregation ATPase
METLPPLPHAQALSESVVSFIPSPGLGLSADGVLRKFETCNAGWTTAVSRFAGIKDGVTPGITFIPMQSNKNLILGFGKNDSPNGYKNIEFAAYCSCDGTFWCSEPGNWTWLGPFGRYSAGDQIQVFLGVSGNVEFLVAGENRFVTHSRPNYPMHVHVSIYHPCAAVTDIRWMHNHSNNGNEQDRWANKVSADTRRQRVAKAAANAHAAVLAADHEKEQELAAAACAMQNEVLEELRKVKRDTEAGQMEVSKLKANLQRVQQEVSQLQSNVTRAMTELRKEKAVLAATKAEEGALIDQLEKEKSAAALAEQELAQVETSLSEERTKLCANKDRNDELQAEISRIKRGADGTRSQVDRIKPEVAKEKANIAATQTGIDKLDLQVKKEKAAAAVLSAELESLNIEMDASKKANKQLFEELQGLRAEQAKVKKVVTATKAQKRDLEAELEKVTSGVALKRRELLDVTAQLRSENVQIESSKAEIGELTAVVEKQRHMELLAKEEMSKVLNDLEQKQKETAENKARIEEFFAELRRTGRTSGAALEADDINSTPKNSAGSVSVPPADVSAG